MIRKILISARTVRRDGDSPSRGSPKIRQPGKADWRKREKALLQRTAQTWGKGGSVEKYLQQGRMKREKDLNEDQQK